MSNGENEEWRRMNDQSWLLSLTIVIKQAPSCSKLLQIVPLLSAVGFE